ncbi:FimV/HubP family polar landmark protein [Alcanivorax quisquiliarum]|uniref:FimV N-terminal domain-containing protein n=1 Tax=Alcanivorax quisquiliarum TaxID=2933565 RepID=A0ABT0E2Z0_9GAMM|nr:FimV/HubP family polar landmark protein [Alcanivorax quisquiliarum]MCK0536182.1 hypothetical protein [Alcanivorax quisquiliarum]
MVRRLMLRGMGIVITTWALAMPGLATALAVGEHELHSYLNEPLDLQVSLSDMGDLTEEQLRVSLASDTDYQRAGLDREALHGDLRFNVELRGDGTGILTISTRQPVREPFLSFLVDYHWPAGRLLREYTVLLDPPSYAAGFRSPTVSAPGSSQASAAAAPAPMASAPPVSESGATTAATPRPSAPAASGPARQASRPAGPRRTRTVRAQDTLWRIASESRPDSSVSVQQMMIVIQEMNPDAFINGNLNLVREGAVLELPGEQEVREISTREALSRVAEQNRQWRDMLQAQGLAVPAQRQLDGTPRTIERGTAGAAPDAGRVTLVTPDAASGEGSGAGSSAAGRAGGSASGNTAALQNELAIRDEGLDQLRRENADLGARLDELEQQLQTSEQILTLRNDQITRLQDELRRLQEERGVSVSADLLAPAPALEGFDQAPAETADNDGAAEAAAGSTSGDAVTATTAPGTAAGGTDADADATESVTETARSARPAPQPVIPPQPALLEQLLGNPLLLGGLGLLLLLLILLAIRARRNKAAAVADEADLDAAAFAEEDFGDDDDFLPALGADDDDAPLMDEPAEPEQDPLEQADVFIAYGQYPQALSYLRSAINTEPSRIDLKKRLLDVLAESNDTAGFQQEATKLAGLNDELDQHIAELRARNTAPDAAEEDISFDDLAMDLSDTGPATPSASGNQPGTTADDEHGALDFTAAGLADEGEPLTLGDDELADFELELPEVEEQGTELEDETDDFSFSLDDTPAPAKNDYSLQDDGLVEDGGLSDEELSAGLSSQPVLDLDAELGTLDDDGSLDFGELSLSGDSDGISVGGDVEDSEAESIELSLGELAFDDEPAATAEAADDTLELTLDEELSLDDLGFEEASLDSEGLVGDSLDNASLENKGAGDDSRDGEHLDDTLSLSNDLTLDDSAPAVAPAISSSTQAAPAVALPDEAGLGDDDDFDFLGETDENATKLDLARAYIDMGDTEGARDILTEVLAEGSEQQQAEAQELLSQVG